MIVPFPAAALRAAATDAPPLLGLPRRWLARLRARSELRALLRQPDSVIADCGLTRARAAREARKPFWRD